MEVEEVDEVIQENLAAIEALASSAKKRKVTFHWPIGYNTETQQEVFGDFGYVQAPLGFFPAQEFQTLMVRTIRETLQGQYGISIGELLGGGEKIRAQMPSEITSEAVDNILTGSNLKVIEAFLHLVEIVPGLLMEVIALSLGVRRDQREEFKERISAPPYLGGLSIDDGVEILKVFIRQNGGPIRRFLASQVREIADEISKIIDQIKSQEEDNPGGMQSSTSSPDIPESS